MPEENLAYKKMSIGRGKKSSGLGCRAVAQRPSGCCAAGAKSWAPCSRVPDPVRVVPMQNSPELDEEGYSIRPEEPGYILCGLVNPKRSWGSQAGHDFFISPLLFSLGLFFCSQIRLPQSTAPEQKVSGCLLSPAVARGALWALADPMCSAFLDAAGP